MGYIWILSIIATLIIADQKKLNVGGYFLLSLVIGPLAVLIVLLISRHKILPSNDLQDMRQELSALRRSFFVLQQKVNSLEAVLNKSTGQEAVAVEREEIEEAPEKIEKVDVVGGRVVDFDPQRKTPAANVEKSSDMELDFGRNWLNKIGIVIFTLGMGFLISYTFKYFGPFFKIVFGYLVGAVLFFIGFKLEAKEKYMNFGRALLGGGWALVYFTTYAMHHFAASRLIENQIIDLCLLALVVVGMMVHVLKYQSEGMMSVALFVAYITATLGQITSFTIISCLLLALVILFLVYNFQWITTFIVGIVMTYAIHYVWVMPNIAVSGRGDAVLGIRTQDYFLMMNFIFLTSYWAVFLAGTHIARTVKDVRLLNILAAANFGNIAFYSVLAYPLILKLFYDQRFAIVLGAGVLYLTLALVMKRAGREKLYISDVVAGIFAITFSLPLKFLPTSTLLLWLIETPFLLFIGFNFKERIFCYLSYALSILVALELIFFGFWERMADVHFMGFTWSWHEFMSLWAAISMAACFYLTRRAKREGGSSNIDEFFDQVFSAAAGFYLTYLIFSRAHQPWRAFALSMEGLGFLAVSIIVGLQRFRIYAYLVLAAGAGIFILNGIYASPTFLKWFLIGTEALIFLGIYFVIKYLYQMKRIKMIFEKEEVISFWAGIFLMVFAIFQYIHTQWITLTLGIVGVALILIGILDKDKTVRLGGLLLFGLTLTRVVLVDLSGLDVIFKIITFIILGILFLGISFIYNRFSMEQEKNKKN